MDTARKTRRRSAPPGPSQSPAVTQVLNTTKSPAPALAIKRSDSAPVTLRGWLYKQGSDGLQLWKKRWFVLSEFCLFYYKDHNEEKVLGSILLPSYTISPLSKDDGVYRKYAFKAEHAGMRTYFFAAETKDSMLQWMNNMSLASILQNENKLRPELLSREMARQGQTQGPRRQRMPPQHQHHQPGPQGRPGYHHQPVSGPPHQLIRDPGETRQPLYANAPPKPRRLNTSRDYSPSPDNSPERLSHSTFSPDHELSHLRQGDPAMDSVPPQFRHRLPQERRTPEVYGRSRFEVRGGPQYPTKDYEEVYNNNIGNPDFNNDTQLAEEVATYNRRPAQTNGGQQPGDMSGGHRQRMARPHSADFLEYERSHPGRGGQPGQPGQPGQGERERRHGVRTQPQRPKSCIGEKIRPGDFWSEEAYAQKMRESAFVLEPPGPRSQSRGPGHGAPPPAVQTLPTRQPDPGHYPELGAHQSSTLPPPVFYQDQVSIQQRPVSRAAHPPNYTSSYQEDQEVANSNFPPSYQSPPQHHQQHNFHPQQQQRVTPNVYGYPPNYNQQPLHLRQQFGGQNEHQNHSFVQSPGTVNRDDRSLQQQMQQHYLSQNRNIHPKDLEYLTHQQFVGYTDTKIIQPPSIPQPLPRKQPPPPVTPQTYQNVPNNSKSFSDPRPVSVCRIEIATQSKLSDKFESDGQDFRRSASARLPKQKSRASENNNNVMNTTMSGESDDSKKNGEAVGREESMKRLLNWKQRMLQSPLTRKSSRNASRTQTPTNSDSPVPSLHNDDIRKRVLEELQFNPETPQPIREKRLSRKGSSGSRSSRSRSSPRIAPSKNQLAMSSDDEEIGDPRQARKRNRSQQSRSRNSSKENKKSPNSKTDQTKLRSRSVSSGISPSYLDQPEYINIASIKSSNFNSSATEKSDIDLVWTSGKIGSHTIGPDDWYRDDFDFDKSHPFLDDPMLLKQYAQILDMKYRDSSNEKIEEILIQNSLAHQADMERGLFEKNSVKKVRDGEECGGNQNGVSGPGSGQFSVQSGLSGLSGRYPDSGYDTLPVDINLALGGADKHQLCVDIDTELSSRKSREIVFSEYQPHHPSESHFSDFQLLNKGDETVLLSIQGHGDNLENNVRPPQRQREADKIIWQLGKSPNDIHRDGKSAPPKNVVKERLKNFETVSDKNQTILANNRSQATATPTPDHRQRGSRSAYQDFSCSSDEEEETRENPSAKKLEHKRSVKDLLSDFEKKSKALQEKEKEHQGGIGSFLLKDTRDGGQRRVCSDTETMHFATSSDDEDSDDFSLDTRMSSLAKSTNIIDQEASAKKTTETNAIVEKAREAMIRKEDTYLAMSPARSLSSLAPAASSLMSVTSVTSCHGSSQSVTSPSLQRLNRDKKPGPLTPAPVDHNRTPSQTMVMEHFHPESGPGQEETYVDMNEDGTRNLNVRKTRERVPVLAKSLRENDNLDNTLTLDPDGSPRYCEIPESRSEPQSDQAHYELLSNARSASSNPQPHYEALYHEISEDRDPPRSVSPEVFSTPSNTRDPPPLRPIEGLPDILGNAPTNKGNSSSDADDESSKDFDAIATKSRQTISLDDSFRPASFYLSRCNTGGQEGDGDSSDSDLVSPPPVPSSPPPMDEVLGITSSNNFDNVNFSEGMNNVFAAARSSSALRERSRIDSLEESPRRPSVGSKSPFMIQPSPKPDSVQNRELAKSPQRLHGSHQSLSSRELPPLPHQNLQGSQQSLASKEIQQIGSRASHHSNENIFRNSPAAAASYHSREGSLDNEAFLFHKFTQGTSISDYYKRPAGSDSAELSSSDTANYEQEYRRYHLENIQEVSNTLERSESGQHNTSTSIISQELNISYNSVYDSRLSHQKGAEEKLPPQKFFELDPRSNEIENEIEMQNINRASQVQSPRSKIPYYMSDIVEDGTSVQRPVHCRDPDHQSGTDSQQEDNPTLGVVDAITKSMNALDVESRSYFEEKNAKENERIKMLRRSYTPDPYLSKAPLQSPLTVGSVSQVSQAPQPGAPGDTQNNVVRSRSLEGLLGDSQGGPKDNLGYMKPTQDMAGPQQRSQRGPPPPPPAGVPPLDIRPLAPALDTEDQVWADSLRRASLRHQRAKSEDSLETGEPGQAGDRAGHSRVTPKPGPPTAPKPKTPVHMSHASHHNSYNNYGASYPGPEPVMRQPPHYPHNTDGHQPPHLPPAVVPMPGSGPSPARHHQEMFRQEFQHQPSHYQQTWQSPRDVSHQSHQTPVQRNSFVASGRNENFLEGGLPTPTSEGHHQRRSVSRPTSRGPSASDWMGRQTSPRDSRSLTLPARIKYSQDSLPRDNSLDTSLSEDVSPRTRTSKSGLHEDSEPVPASPASGPAQQNISQNTLSDPSFSSQKDLTSHQNYRDAGEDLTRARRRSYTGGNNRKSSTDLEILKKKFGGNLANITAGDLLNKSQEELVLILIQLRRQSASLLESIDACKAEQDNSRNHGQGPSLELRQHTWDLEEQLARVNPVINLVDNMVKLGTLYRGQDNSPLSQRMANIHSEAQKSQQENTNKRISQDYVERQQAVLEKELARVQTQLKISHKALVENGSDMSKFERDLNALSVEFHNSVARDRHRGIQSSSRVTMSIETDLRVIQQKTVDLSRVRNDVMQHIQSLRQQEDDLMDEIRKAPSGVSGAEQLPQKKRNQNTWYETDIDNNYTRDRGPETEQQIAKETNNISKPGTIYINAEDEHHNYENFDTYENFKNNLAKNPYEDDVQTVHSEGVRSELEGPPLPERPNKIAIDNDNDLIMGMGDIGEADEKVQRFYGILPKEKPIEIKTVRMVKRDNKERSSKTKRGNSEEDSESVELSVEEEEDLPPPPLPRGNYQNLHNFLSNKPYDSFTANYSSPSGENKTSAIDNKMNTDSNKNLSENKNDYLRRLSESRAAPVFRVGEVSHTVHRSQESLSRPTSSMSAHERLFGMSRDSLSPEVSPVKTSSMVSSDSSQSAIMSPVFKSAAARAIIEEERKTPMIIPKAKKKGKKRHMTITSSHPAVLEALTRHDAKMDLRSRDDMDIERTLKQPSDAPDLVQSTFGQNSENLEIKTHTFDNLFGVPDKINIPERYVPDQAEESSPEERKTRLKKADSIRRMLADSSATPVVKRKDSDKEVNLNEEKRHREQILALNQVLAQQVLQKSRSASRGPRD